MRNSTRALFFGVIIAGAAACSATTAYVTTSRPAERQISVDGKSDDWTGALSMIRDGKAEEGFLNDDQSLYLCFVTEDVSFGRQIAGGGLTVWFDPAGGGKKILGIKYPSGRQRRGRGFSPNSDEGEAGQERGESDASSLEVLRSGSASPQRLKISDAEGLEVATSMVGGLFVYELKIPIGASAGHPVALAAAPGDKIGVGIEASTPEGRASMDRGEGGRGGRGGMGGMGGMGGRGGGGMGGMGGGGRGRMGGGMGEGGREMEPESAPRLKVWTYVKLTGGKNASDARPTGRG